jgi:large subunit ribosomal protein L24
MALNKQPKKAKKMPTVNLKKGDTVKVIAGKDKGAEGKIIKVLREEQRVIVEGVNRIKRHTKVVNQGGRAGTTGGIITVEAPIHVSNVMLAEGDGVTRIGFRRDEVTKRRPDGSTYAATRSVRISRKTGKEI